MGEDDFPDHGVNIKVVDNVENYLNIKGAPPGGFESRQVGTFFTLYVFCIRVFDIGRRVWY